MCEELPELPKPDMPPPVSEPDRVRQHVAWLHTQPDGKRALYFEADHTSVGRWQPLYL